MIQNKKRKYEHPGHVSPPQFPNFNVTHEVNEQVFKPTLNIKLNLELKLI